MAPGAPGVDQPGQPDRDHRAYRERPPQGVRAERGVEGEIEAEAHRVIGDDLDDHRGDHHAIGAQGAGHDHHRAHHDIGPGHDVLDVLGDRQGRAAAAEEQREQRVRSGDDQGGQQPGQRQVGEHADIGDLAYPLVIPRADVLGDHGADRRAEREGRHLQVVPELHRGAVGGRGVEPLAVDQADDDELRGGDQQHLRPHRQALADDVGQVPGARDQIAQLVPPQPQRQVAAVEAVEHQQATAEVGEAGRQRRSGDAQRGDRPQAADQQRIEHDVERHGQDHRVERRLGIAAAAQAHAQHHRDGAEGHRHEDHLEIGLGLLEAALRRGEDAQQPFRDEPADQADDHRHDHAEAEPAAEGAARRIDVAVAEVLPDPHGRRVAEPEDRGEQQEHHDVGVGRGGQRALTQQAADPDRIDRAVQRLDHVADQHGDREHDHRAQDRPLRQVAAHRLTGGRSAFRTILT